MGKTYLLDCTLRDGGYINDWHFGEDAIKGFIKKIAETGIEMLEVGFIKGETYNPQKSVFPDTNSFTNVITHKSSSMLYVGMLDMSAPVKKSYIYPRSNDSIDGIRVIFKKDKIKEAYEYCSFIKKQGYMLFVNFVGTDQYSDREFIEGIEKFNTLQPNGVTIVDTFGMIKRKQFLRLVYLADNNLSKNIMLCYHAHNNLQQAFGNAEALVEMNLKRNICIDACIFGMGRGAGNLNLELFAEYMNENYDTNYKIEPMLEIMDEYLMEFYKTKFWGYSLPLYLSATLGCHPNYAIYLAEKDTLNVKSFNELLQNISPKDKLTFSKDKAEFYYRQYLERNIDDSLAISKLFKLFKDKHIILLAPGKSLRKNNKKIKQIISLPNTIVIATNFTANEFEPQFIFSSNMRRFSKIQGKTKALCITTSNMEGCGKTDFVVNFSSYASSYPEIIDNSGIMLLKLLAKLGIKEVSIAGMDGYNAYDGINYSDDNLEYDFSKESETRNKLISEELKEISEKVKIIFLTPTVYKF